MTFAGNNKPIYVKNYHTQEMFQETVFHQAGLEILYKSTIGKIINGSLTQSLISKIYGAYYNSPRSLNKIKGFIKKYNINTDEYNLDDINSFNDFFTRTFKKEARSFEAKKNIFSAFAEGRYFVYENIKSNQLFKIKQQNINLPQLINETTDNLKAFENGTLICCRLAPQDYHHYHFPTHGSIVSRHQIPGKLHSVGPIAQSENKNIYLNNYRQISLCSSKEFGDYYYIEIGALTVGKIINNHKGTSFNKGDKKGYFKFGGSTVVVLLKPNAIKLNKKLLSASYNESIESWVQLGTTIGVKK